MIHVDRPKEVPEALTRRDNKGRTETERAIEFYRDGKNQGRPFKGFRAYRDPAVRDALNRLFHGKCAYCESRYAATP